MWAELSRGVRLAVIDIISAAQLATARQLCYQLALLGAAMLGSCVGLTGQVSL